MKHTHTHTHSMSMLTVGIWDMYSQTQGWVNNSCRSTRNSFKRAVDRSCDKDATPTEGSGEQREVDGRLSWKQCKESFRVLLAVCSIHGHRGQLPSHDELLQEP